MGGKTFLIEMGLALSEVKVLLHLQPRLMHFSRSDWSTPSRLSAHIPWFDLKANFFFSAE